ncbi:MAG: hypothetical protein RLZZ308_48 [Candidatus Parcubacteria bacterium]|jgi:hypothetical protein
MSPFSSEEENHLERIALNRGATVWLLASELGIAVLIVWAMYDLFKTPPFVIILAVVAYVLLRFVAPTSLKDREGAGVKLD